MDEQESSYVSQIAFEWASVTWRMQSETQRQEQRGWNLQVSAETDFWSHFSFFGGW